MKIIEENGKKYAEMNCRSVAEVMGLVPAGSSEAIRFQVEGCVENAAGDEIPMLGIKMMSDEKWNRYAEEGAVRHFRERHGREPESVKEALADERAFIERLEGEKESRDSALIATI